LLKLKIMKQKNFTPIQFEEGLCESIFLPLLIIFDKCKYLLF
jgi:hypothetical protein